MSNIEEALERAVAEHRAGRLQQAERLYRDILKSDPNQADAWHLLGLIAHQVGRLDAAQQAIRRALRLRPGAAPYHNSLGVVLAAEGRAADAVTCYRNALKIQSDYAEAHNNLGVVLSDLDEPAKAVAEYERAIAINPNYVDAHRNLGNARKRLGEPVLAIEAYQRALELAPGDSLRFAAATVLPVIYESSDQMHVYRRRFVDEVTALVDSGMQLNPIADRLPHTFHLAYQGENDRPVQELLARMFAGSSRDFTEGRRRKPGAQGRIRVGFLSSFFHAHTVSKVWRGVIEHLSRDRFEVCVLSLDNVDDPINREIQNTADRFIALPKQLHAARQQIAEERLDVLYYTDIGMNPSSQALAVSRLAPVQCVTWGHPVTTGLSSIDYFVSSRLLETDAANEHYTERLIRLERMGVYYHRPTYPLPRKSRADFSLPDDRHIYACPQSLFKLDPDYDLVLAEMLRRDPRGIIVLVSGMCAHWEELLKRRFETTMPDVAGRIRFLPRLSYNDYLRLINVVDVLLVPHRFGGGSTSYEALAFGVPIVTWPSPLLRGRITYALYRQMGIDDCIADGPLDYVEKAVRLAADAGYRSGVSSEILAACDRIFEDLHAIRELEQFLESAVEQTAGG